ncbi:MULTISPECIES: Rieske (2Fe-2S) protein [Brevibacterium]|uniref:Rieske (2Fe-2S) protein n=2 Tax=Brevibacterium TaxID=1696 RepID=A0ABP9U428_9MICO|nr:Rieske 2Fe-2S domain-containing protein [Brevibacterium sp. 2SA]
MPAKQIRRVRVAHSADLSNGRRLIVDIGESTIGLFRFKDEVYAYANTCPHQGGPVCQGLLTPRVKEDVQPDRTVTGMLYDVDRLHIVCPWHGAEFDVTTGRHATTDKLRLQPYTVTEEEGEIYVDLR